MTIELQSAAALEVSDVTLSLRPGELTLLVGRTGAGKTTLLRAICGLERLRKGAVRIDEVSLWTNQKVSSQALRDVSLVVQSPEQQLFANSVAGEFRYSLRPYRLSPEDIRKRMADALDAVGLPQNLSEVPPKSLSGGQQRRVALATALSTQPAWLLLDEPTAGLDAEAAKRFSQDICRVVDEGAGVILATHDLDIWLPLATRVIILESGRVLADISGPELADSPSPLVTAGVGLPSSALCASYLFECGWPVSKSAISAEALAEQLLDAIESDQQPEGKQGDANVRIPVAETRAKHQPLQTLEPQPTLEPRSTRQPRSTLEPGTPASASKLSESLVENRSSRRLRAFDARAKWISYVMLSITLVAIPPFGLWAATLLVAAVFISSGVSWLKLWHLLRPFLLFVIGSVAFSGLTWPIGYSVPAGFHTLLSLYRIVLVLILGVLFTNLTSTLEMKQGLESALGWTKRLHVPVEAIAFGVSLVLRFIPVLSEEAKRFAEIAQIRGKQTGRPGRIRLRDAPQLLMPLLFSVFQLGEDLSFAMEARGLQRFGLPRTRSSSMQWQRRDTVFTLTSVIITGILVLVSIGLQRWFA
ncbi:ATP-binding cassette domain-containing protein [Alicyclobacillus ferrooxydans]|uniref:ATP-binding cassette domain-containing protein n=1 Tax=Alicyclobacillus ferrooxydans TaxID=471514 RepID=UPI0006D54E21|nr:ATP-binding cassette domain-containing protein [Alicyclobacillus ferrooxydans]